LLADPELSIYDAMLTWAVCGECEATQANPLGHWQRTTEWGAC
jgi:hypothetical protein